MFTITIHFQQEGLSSINLQRVEQGYSLLEICMQNNILLHHNCGGICSCSTCHVYINKGDKHLNDKSRREEDFLKRARKPQDNSRLACQTILFDDAGELDITIPDQTGL